MKRHFFIITIVFIFQSYTYTVKNNLTRGTRDDRIRQMLTFKKSIKKCKPNCTNDILKKYKKHLLPHGITGYNFISFIAHNKEACAMQEFSKEFDINGEDIQKIGTDLNLIKKKDANEQEEKPCFDYEYPKDLENNIEQLNDFLDTPNYAWPSKMTVYYGTDDENAPYTLRSMDQDGTFGNPELYLESNFLELPDQAQVTLINHEYIHTIKEHCLKRGYLLSCAINKALCKQTGKTLQEIDDYINQNEHAHAKLLKDITASDKAYKLRLAHEYQADWLSFLLGENPRTIAQGAYLLEERDGFIDDPTRTSSKKRCDWFTRLASLLEVEKQLFADQ